MTLPDFIICGAQKSGTTSLYSYVTMHPDVIRARAKEVHYFDINYNRGVEWYKKHFPNKSPGKVTGEASPDYMYIEWVPERIHELLPDVKLIFILRNPVSRAYSHYWHVRRRGYERLPFDRAIREERRRLDTDDVWKLIRYSYRDKGRYAVQLKRYRKYFSDEQMLVVLSEELRINPGLVLKRIFEFLGVDPNVDVFKSSQPPRKNVGRSPRYLTLSLLHGYLFDLGVKVPRAAPVLYYVRGVIRSFNFREGYPPMDNETREGLVDYFRPYNRRLKRYFPHATMNEEGWFNPFSSAPHEPAD